MKKNILLLADQPWQADQLVRICNKINAINANYKFHLAFTDFYTIHWRRDYLRGLENAFNGNVYTQEVNYKQWSNEDNGIETNSDYIDKWANQNLANGSIESLLRTCSYLYPDEKSFYTKKLTESFKLKYLHDNLKWTEELLNSVEPKLIVCIERTGLVQNIFFNLSKVQSFSMLTLIPARVDNRWIIRKDFAYGVSDELFAYINKTYSNSGSMELATNYSQKMLSSNHGLYYSLNHQYIQDFNNSLVVNTKKLIKDLRFWLSKVYGRMFILSRIDPFKSSKIKEILKLKTLFELKIIFYEFFHRLGVVKIGERAIPKDPYFLWALQYRPESSVKVLGEGRDEVEEILKAANDLPEGYLLAVKENSLMIGSRSLGFYKILEKHRKIVLLEPNISSIDLILQSVGVIGISGTVLFEAAVLNKPSCALGHPEFSAFLVSHGWESSQTFFRKVVGGTFESPIKKIYPYIAYVLTEGKDLDSLRDMDAERPLSDEILDSFAQKITSQML